MLTHKEIKERCKYLLNNKYDEDILTDSNPDIKVITKEREFDSLWYEVESPNFPRPANIALSVISACLENSIIKFAVPAEDNRRVDYYANRIDNILCPPHLMRSTKSDYTCKLYKQNSYLSDGEGNIPLLPKDCNSGEWYYDSRKDEIQYVNRDYEIEITNPNRSIVLDDLTIYYDTENNNLVKNSSQKSVSFKKVLAKNKRIPAPVHTQNVPRNQLRKTIQNIEYLIVGENVMYKRTHPNINPIDTI